MQIAGSGAFLVLFKEKQTSKGARRNMLSALKNFGITFGVGLIIFGLLAFGITKFAVNSFANGFTSDQSQDQDADNAADDGSNESKMDLSGIGEIGRAHV